MRCLLLILVPLLIAAPVHTQSNPTVDPTCRLPKRGVIVESVTYTLKADCVQSGPLEIRTADTPNITLTINGEGFTISNGTGRRDGMNFLVVDDQGYRTTYNLDTTASPGAKVIINDVTFDNNNLNCWKHIRQGVREDGSTWLYRGYIGAWILAEGTLEMEDVTFTRGECIWLDIQGTATLTNMLFKDSVLGASGLSSSVQGILQVTHTGSATLNNAVFRNIRRTNVVIEKGGSLRTTGCLTFDRILTHRVHHSGLRNHYGTWTDSSTGACPASKTIGNNEPAVVAPSQTFLDPDCGMPVEAFIGEDTVYTLKSDCVCLKWFRVGAGVKVTINGNGFSIQGCPGTLWYLYDVPRGAEFIIGGEGAHLKITNANIYGIRVRNRGGYFTLGESMLAQTAPTPIMNYGWFHAYKSTFQDNGGSGTTKGNVYKGRSTFNMGHGVFEDSMFRNNGLGAIELHASGGHLDQVVRGK